MEASGRIVAAPIVINRLLASRLRCVPLTRVRRVRGLAFATIMWVLRGLVESGIHRVTSNLNKQISSRLSLRRAGLIGAATAEIDRTGAKGGLGRWCCLPAAESQVNSRGLGSRALSLLCRYRLEIAAVESTSIARSEKVPEGRFGNLSSRLVGGHAGFSIPRPRRGDSGRVSTYASSTCGASASCLLRTSCDLI